MQKIKCPSCGKVFQVDDAGYAQIVQQVRDKEFEKELSQRRADFDKEKSSAVDNAVVKTEAQKDKEIAALNLELARKDQEISRLSSQIELEKTLAESKVNNAVQAKDGEILQLQSKKLR